MMDITTDDRLCDDHRSESSGLIRVTTICTTYFDTLSMGWTVKTALEWTGRCPDGMRRSGGFGISDAKFVLLHKGVST